MKYIKTYESFQSVEVVNEEFFGKKSYQLDSFKPSQKTEDFFNKRKDLVSGGTFKNSQGKVSKVEGYINTFKRLGVPDDLAVNAAKALIEFSGGYIDKEGKAQSVPQMNHTYTFDKEKKILVIDPNGKGLFNGHPIMG